MVSTQNDPEPGSLPRLQHDDPLHSANVSNPPGDRKTGFFGHLRNRLRLPVPDLQNRSPTDPENARQISEQSTHQIEAILTAVEGRPRVVTNFDWHPPDIIRRHVGKVCDNHVPRRIDRGGKVTQEQRHSDSVTVAVAQRNRQRRGRSVDRRHPPPGTFGGQGQGDAAGSGTDVEHFRLMRYR